MADTDTRHLKVFISAVSSQFRFCRQALASDLRAIGCDVRVQEDFQQGSGTLLERLEAYIRDCDRVIALVGDAFGAPAAGIVLNLASPRSYTQWEYCFAEGERLDGSAQPPKELHVYRASGDFLETHAVEQPQAAGDAQRAFIDRIDASGKHWSTFNSTDELCRNVLRDVWRIDTPYRVSVDDYLRARVDEWCSPRHALNSTFTPLTLVLQDADSGFAPTSPRTTCDPNKLLALREPACVLLGPPGSGKSTVLRWLDLDLARQGLAGATTHGPIPLYASLSRYRLGASSGPVTPWTWLEREWTRLQPAGPTFDAVLRTGRFVLLLDALNEIPRRDVAQYRAAVEDWRDFVAALARVAAGTRVLFSCRELDYAISLSGPEQQVLQARVLPLDDEQMRAFVVAYGNSSSSITLGSHPLLQITRSPYYLRLALRQPHIPEGGRVALFTGAVRHALTREVERGNPLFESSELLDPRDRNAVISGRWHGTHSLPGRGTLFPSLARLALRFQQQTYGGSAGLRPDIDRVLGWLGGSAAEATVHAGVALQVLDIDAEQVSFVHRLMQAYFAGHDVAALQPAALSALLESVCLPWRTGEVFPALFDAVRQLGKDDALSPSVSVLDDTLPFAAAMHPQPELLLATLADANLPLAGRCAAELGPLLPSTLRNQLGARLLARVTDVRADVRARLAAGLALGDIGDPRLVTGRGGDGEYLLPAMALIPAGDYELGVHTGGRANETPAHRVQLEAFRLACLPVTNAEFACFIRTGGYDDPRWWKGEPAQRWWDGRDTGHRARREWRAEREHWRNHLHELTQLERQGAMTAAQVAYWTTAAYLSDAECERWLDRMYVAGRQTEPRFWNDSRFNHPAQPVVGVSWFEAEAYCSWLSSQSGLVVRLPSEAQWEAAARGLEARLYPFGTAWRDEGGNTEALRLRRTSPVGIFPLGTTPEGVCDLAGNVWEWTRSASMPYPYCEAADAGDAGERIARGGAYSFSPEFARATYRYHAVPDTRRRRIGFRLAQKLLDGV